MASSNKHWPSMFKSKPCNNPHHQQWHQHLLSSSGNCLRSSYSSGPGCEERTPEPKPRWNPRPEQIRILEAIFNSGMVNPPRDEIRKIRAQLQEYGHVGDANVFYWFQNRKSRSKHKQRQLQNGKSQPPQQSAAPPTPPPVVTANAASTTAIVTAASSSSSSSDKSSSNNSNEKTISVAPTTAIDLLNSPSASVNQQSFFQPSGDFLAESFLFPSAGGGSSPGNLAQGFWLSNLPNVVDQGLENCPNFLLNELMMNQFPPNKDEMKLQQTNLGFAAPIAETVIPPPIPVPSLSSQNNQGAGTGEMDYTKSTVFINDVCFEVAAAPFNVRDAFGDDAVLVQSSSGQPVLTNAWGETLQPLQHGGFYYLSRPFNNERTIDMI